MTVADIINEYDSDHSNNLTTEQKVRWIRRIESRIKKEIIQTHVHDSIDDTLSAMFGEDDESFVEGTTLYFGDGAIVAGDDTDKDFGLETKLIVPEPYDELYLYYIDARDAHSHNETARYNAAVSLFNQAYLEYVQYYNRTHKVRQPATHLFQHSRLY